MIISGHQAVYLPWLGLFHKLYLCDIFVYMDTVQYLSKDWNNRNKIRTPHGSSMLTVPIDKKKSTGKDLHEIYIKSFDDPDDRNNWQKEHFINISFNYKKTPYFDKYIGELEKMYLDTKWEKLIDLCWAQFELFRTWLGLSDKKVVRMTEFEFNGYKDNLVLDHCKKLNGNKVVFGTHGKDYVDIKKFNNEGIKVYFQDYQHPVYNQRYSPFEPYMCVLDLLFNCGDESMDVLLKGNVSYKELNENDNYWN